MRYTPDLILPILFIASLATYHTNRRLLEYAIVEAKPLIYTYYDANVTFSDEKLLEIFSDSWTTAGYDVKVLGPEDAKKHSNYNEYEERLDGSDLSSLTKFGYFRLVAMSTVDGGYFSELHTLPLHKRPSLSSLPSSLRDFSSLPNKGEITFQDGAFGSIISGNEEEFNNMVKFLMDNIDDEIHSSYQRIYDTPTVTVGNQTSTFHFENNELLENVLNYKLDICKRAESKFFVRLHGKDLQTYRNSVLKTRHKVEYRPLLLENWWNFYKSLCLNEHNKLGSDNIFPKETELSLENEDLIDTVDSSLVIDNTTMSTVTCDEVSCVITKACVSKEGTIKVFGHDNAQVDALAARVKYIMTHEWKCHGCSNKVIIEKGAGDHMIWSKTATFSTGLSLHNCGHHIGDHIWPLIRLHLKFRDVDDVIQNGLGYLFLESAISPCDALYHAIAEQVIRFKTIPQHDMCFDNIYVGTRAMKFMNDIPNSYFISYEHFHRDMHAMRSLFWNTFGILESNKTQPIVMDTIIITQKRVGLGQLRSYKYHNIANTPQIVKMIQTEFPTYQVQIVTWEDQTVQQQVSLMARTKIMISLPGAAIINAFLFQDNATLLCYCQKGEEDHRIDSSTIFANNGTSRYQLSDDVRLWFDHFDYGNYYQICNESDMSFSGRDTIVDVDALKERLNSLGL